MLGRFCKPALCCLLAAGLVGCGFKDGVYSAEFASFDSLGYKDRLEVTVQDGTIVQADFDAVDRAGGKKSQDEAYARRMRPLCGTDPAQLSAHYGNLLLQAERYGAVEVDAVSGATVSSRRFAALWAALKKPLQKGKTGPVVVSDAPELSPPAQSGGATGE